MVATQVARDESVRPHAKWDPAAGVEQRPNGTTHTSLSSSYRLARGDRRRYRRAMTRQRAIFASASRPSRRAPASWFPFNLHRSPRSDRRVVIDVRR
jgi:hypothetical protein